MLTALNSTNQLVVASRAARTDGPFTCPQCEQPVILKRGSWVIDHFAHKAGERHADCPNAGESETHAAIKLAIYTDALAAGIEAHMEYRIGDRIADLVLHGKRRRIAVEIQLSPQSFEELLARTRNHNRHGYACLWVVQLYEDAAEIQKNAQYPVRAFQREIHDLCGGALFQYRGGLYFDTIHLMGYSYVTYRYFKISFDPTHLFKTVDAGREDFLLYVTLPEALRWWERLKPRSRNYLRP